MRNCPAGRVAALATSAPTLVNASMNSRLIRTTCATASLALAFGGCSTTNQEPGIYSGASGAAAGAIVRAGSGPGGTMVAGASVGSMAIANIHIIAKRQASLRQRKIAEERARAFQSHLSVRRRPP